LARNTLVSSTRNRNDVLLSPHELFSLELRDMVPEVVPPPQIPAVGFCSPHILAWVVVVDTLFLPLVFVVLGIEISGSRSFSVS